MKNATKIIVSAVTAVAVVGAALGVHYGYAKTTDETKTYTVETENDMLRVAVISDLQMPDSKDKNTHQYESYKNTLTMLKNRGMDVLLIGGDFTDLGTRTAWNSCKEIYDEVMADSEKPIPLYIMGNHDYWLDYFFKSWEIPAPAKMQKRFTKYTGEYPYSHKIINGYHFICWSSSDGSYDKSYQNKEWVRAQLDQAVADDPNKPIFVISHLNPSNTAYGSDEWGNDDIYDVLKDYSQVISLSGHSHYSLLDERSIWQGDFTAFTTQSLDYIELESGKFNGSVPVDAYGNSIADDVPMCLYMEIENDKVTVERLNSATGEQMKEPWVIEAPFGSPSKYTDNRKNTNEAPVLDEKLTVKISDIKDVNDKSQKMISFKAGTDDDFVHSYRLQFLDENRQVIEFDETDYDGNVLKYDGEGNQVSSDSEDYDSASTKKINEVLYFSDFVVGLDKMSDTAELRLPSTVPENVVYVSVTAIDSWGAESKAVICQI